EEEGSAWCRGIVELAWNSISYFSMLPSLVWCVYGVWVAQGWSIPRVCPSSGVATVVVAIAVPFPITMVSQRPRGTQQCECVPRVFRGSGWGVGVCPRADLPLGPSRGEHGRLPHCVQ
ncbi:hypothetical protein Taro_042179, partial [Colocasia esculenta]|nr:hypothetical protein [Colocasia esculenta]